MTSPYLCSEILLNARDRGMIPNTDEALNDTRLRRILNDELQGYLVPLILGVREDFFVTQTTYALAAGAASVRLPNAAVAGGVRLVVWVAEDGGETPLERVAFERFGLEGFTLQGNNLIFTSALTEARTLRISYERRPNRVVDDAAARALTAKTTTTLTVASVPATFTASVAYDFVAATPGFECFSVDATPSGLATTTFTFASLPSGLAVGDYLCLAGESPVPQVPAELHPLLAQRIAYVALRGLGDAKAEAARVQADEMRAGALTMLTPRAAGHPRYLFNPYAPGGLSTVPLRWRR
jgi:hypothetical protein